jgi:hypothetical protein
MSKRLVSIVMGAAILGASAAAGAQTATSPKPGDTMSSQKTIQNQIDFKVMDSNADGMISREEYVNYYGGRFDRMKRNDKGMVMMQDVRMWDDRSNPTSDTPTKSRPGVKGGAGSPPATGGG